ncbi:unnamed protein product [Adineta ricciae]|uniref:F-box domain-containing protein n=2 Tax=Adineta ricciae TaxID=249248 RepID=A0A815EU36_ADIRI|nr:unnamed protein product [Adineta ricciae]
MLEISNISSDLNDSFVFFSFLTSQSQFHRLEFRMDQIKRQRCDSFNDNKRQKTDDCCVTRFEDLANEIIYEIFDYLDSYHVHKAFFRLNYRFQSFLIESNLPLRINIPLMSPSTFHRYNDDIIQPNIQQIHSIHVSHYFMYDEQTLPLTQMTFLRSLVIEKIESRCLQNLANQLILLSHLSSLSIMTIDTVKDKIGIYEQIFRLPSLRYCKLSLENPRYQSYDVPSIHLNEQSSIEHLVIDHQIKYIQLNSFLPYVPRLRHLSLHLSSDYEYSLINVPCHVLNNLTHLSLKSTYKLRFETLERILINHFSLVEVLRLSVSLTTLDANKWKQLISTHLSKLRIFDVRFIFYSYDNAENVAYEEQVTQFQSSFWIERQWFFHSEIIRFRYPEQKLFFSVNAYRKKDYRVYKQSNEESFTGEIRTMFYSVDHVEIGDERAINQCMSYFPNANKLTLEDRFSNAGYLPSSIGINRILSLQRIKTLVIKCHHFSLIKMIDLLSCIPNLQILAFKTMPLYKEGRKSIEQNDKFRLLSETNSITSISFEERSTPNKTELLIKLFPRIQYLEMNTYMKDMEAILQLLVKQNTPDLLLTCFTYASEVYFRHLTGLIDSKVLSTDYKVTHAGRKLYLW